MRIYIFQFLKRFENACSAWVFCPILSSNTTLWIAILRATYFPGKNLPNEILTHAVSSSTPTFPSNIFIYDDQSITQLNNLIMSSLTRQNYTAKLVSNLKNPSQSFRISQSMKRAIHLRVNRKREPVAATQKEEWNVRKFRKIQSPPPCSCVPIIPSKYLFPRNATGARFLQRAREI